MEVMRKTDLHLGETEATGLEDEAKAEARLVTGRRDQVGLSQSGKVHELDLVHQICLSREFKQSGQS